MVQVGGVPRDIALEAYIVCVLGQPISSNAFILPQWGGIVLLNDPTPHLSVASLQQTVSIFRQQLLALLGAPVQTQHGVFPDDELYDLVRRRTYENVKDTKETLQSIVALVQQIENMPVGQDVKGDVQDSLNCLDQVRVLLVAKRVLPDQSLTRPSLPPRRRQRMPFCIPAKHLSWHRARSSTRVCSRCSTSQQSTNTLCIHHCLLPLLFLSSLQLCERFSRGDEEGELLPPPLLANRRRIDVNLCISRCCSIFIHHCGSRQNIYALLAASLQMILCSCALATHEHTDVHG